MSDADKLYLVKTLIIPSLTYPCVPLNACSITSYLKLQRVLNRALRFVYRRGPEMPTVVSLLNRAKLLPINQILYNRAKNIWAKIESGIAGDIDTFHMISGIPIEDPHSWYPSSLERSRKDPPPPITTRDSCILDVVKDYYKGIV